ncbi:MAG: histidine phosphatase family protein [Actinomycetota bacterium]
MPAPARVLVLRHGTSEWNIENRWQGWLDAPLTADGATQANARGSELARAGIRPRVVYCSDLGRAVRTAEIMAARLECPVFPDMGFRERHGGDWQGLTGAEIDARWPGQRDAWRHGRLRSPPGGETDDLVLARFDTAIHRALAHTGESLLLIVTHHGILRLVATRTGIDVHTLIPNLGGYWFDVVDGALTAAEPAGALPSDDERPAVE